MVRKVVEGVVTVGCEWGVWLGSGEGCSHMVRIQEGCGQGSDGGYGKVWWRYGQDVVRSESRIMEEW